MDMEQEFTDAIEELLVSHHQAKTQRKHDIASFIRDKDFDKLREQFLPEDGKGSAANEEQKKLIKETIEKDIEPAYHNFKEAFEADGADNKMEALTTILKYSKVKDISSEVDSKFQQVEKVVNGHLASAAKEISGCLGEQEQ